MYQAAARGRPAGLVDAGMWNNPGNQGGVNPTVAYSLARSMGRGRAPSTVVKPKITAKFVKSTAPPPSDQAAPPKHLEQPMAPKVEAPAEIQRKSPAPYSIPKSEYRRSSAPTPPSGLSQETVISGLSVPKFRGRMVRKKSDSSLTSKEETSPKKLEARKAMPPEAEFKRRGRRADEDMAETAGRRYAMQLEPVAMAVLTASSSSQYEDLNEPIVEPKSKQKKIFPKSVPSFAITSGLSNPDLQLEDPEVEFKPRGRRHVPKEPSIQTYEEDVSEPVEEPVVDSKQKSKKRGLKPTPKLIPEDFALTEDVPKFKRRVSNKEEDDYDAEALPFEKRKGKKHTRRELSEEPSIEELSLAELEPKAKAKHPKISAVKKQFYVEEASTDVLEAEKPKPKKRGPTQLLELESSEVPMERGKPKKGQKIKFITTEHEQFVLSDENVYDVETDVTEKTKSGVKRKLQQEDVYKDAARGTAVSVKLKPKQKKTAQHQQAEATLEDQLRAKGSKKKALLHTDEEKNRKKLIPEPSEIKGSTSGSPTMSTSSATEEHESEGKLHMLSPTIEGGHKKRDKIKTITKTAKIPREEDIKVMYSAAITKVSSDQHDLAEPKHKRHQRELKQQGKERIGEKLNKLQDARNVKAVDRLSSKVVKEKDKRDKKVELSFDVSTKTPVVDTFEKEKRKRSHKQYKTKERHAPVDENTIGEVPQDLQISSHETEGKKRKLRSKSPSMKMRLSPEKYVDSIKIVLLPAKIIGVDVRATESSSSVTDDDTSSTTSSNIIKDYQVTNPAEPSAPPASFVELPIPIDRQQFAGSPTAAANMQYSTAEVMRRQAAWTAEAMERAGYFTQPFFGPMRLPDIPDVSQGITTANQAQGVLMANAQQGFVMANQFADNFYVELLQSLSNMSPARQIVVTETAPTLDRLIEGEGESRSFVSGDADVENVMPAMVAEEKFFSYEEERGPAFSASPTDRRSFSTITIQDIAPYMIVSSEQMVTDESIKEIEDLKQTISQVLEQQRNVTSPASNLSLLLSAISGGKVLEKPCAGTLSTDSDFSSRDYHLSSSQGETLVKEMKIDFTPVVNESMPPTQQFGPSEADKQSQDKLSVVSIAPSEVLPEMYVQVGQTPVQVIKQVDGSWYSMGSNVSASPTATSLPVKVKRPGNLSLKNTTSLVEPDIYIGSEVKGNIDILLQKAVPDEQRSEDTGVREQSGMQEGDMKGMDQKTVTWQVTVLPMEKKSSSVAVEDETGVSLQASFQNFMSEVVEMLATEQIASQSKIMLEDARKESIDTGFGSDILDHLWRVVPRSSKGRLDLDLRETQDSLPELTRKLSGNTISTSVVMQFIDDGRMLAEETEISIENDGLADRSFTEAPAATISTAVVAQFIDDGRTLTERTEMPTEGGGLADENKELIGSFTEAAAAKPLQPMLMLEETVVPMEDLAALLSRTISSHTSAISKVRMEFTASEAADSQMKSVSSETSRRIRLEESKLDPAVVKRIGSKHSSTSTFRIESKVNLHDEFDGIEKEDSEVIRSKLSDKSSSKISSRVSEASKGTAPLETTAEGSMLGSSFYESETASQQIKTASSLSRTIPLEDSNLEPDIVKSAASFRLESKLKLDDKLKEAEWELKDAISKPSVKSAGTISRRISGISKGTLQGIPVDVIYGGSFNESASGQMKIVSSETSRTNQLEGIKIEPDMKSVSSKQSSTATFRIESKAKVDDHKDESESVSSKPSVKSISRIVSSRIEGVLEDTERQYIPSQVELQKVSSRSVSVGTKSSAIQPLSDHEVMDKVRDEDSLSVASALSMHKSILSESRQIEMNQEISSAKSISSKLSASKSSAPPEGKQSDVSSINGNQVVEASSESMVSKTNEVKDAWMLEVEMHSKNSMDSTASSIKAESARPVVVTDLSQFKPSVGRFSYRSSGVSQFDTEVISSVSDESRKSVPAPEESYKSSSSIVDESLKRELDLIKESIIKSTESMSGVKGLVTEMEIEEMKESEYLKLLLQRDLGIPAGEMEGALYKNNVFYQEPSIVEAIKPSGSYVIVLEKLSEGSGAATSNEEKTKVPTSDEYSSDGIVGSTTSAGDENIFLPTYGKSMIDERFIEYEDFSEQPALAKRDEDDRPISLVHGLVQKQSTSDVAENDFLPDGEILTTEDSVEWDFKTYDETDSSEKLTHGLSFLSEPSQTRTRLTSVDGELPYFIIPVITPGYSPEDGLSYLKEVKVMPYYDIEEDLTLQDTVTRSHISEALVTIKEEKSTDSEILALKSSFDQYDVSKLHASFERSAEADEESTGSHDNRDELPEVERSPQFLENQLYLKPSSSIKSHGSNKSLRSETSTHGLKSPRSSASVKQLQQLGKTPQAISLDFGTKSDAIKSPQSSDNGIGFITSASVDTVTSKLSFDLDKHLAKLSILSISDESKVELPLGLREEDTGREVTKESKRNLSSVSNSENRSASLVRSPVLSDYSYTAEGDQLKPRDKTNFVEIKPYPSSASTKPFKSKEPQQPVLETPQDSRKEIIQEEVTAVDIKPYPSFRSTKSEFLSDANILSSEPRERRREYASLSGFSSVSSIMSSPAVEMDKAAEQEGVESREEPSIRSYAAKYEVKTDEMTPGIGQSYRKPTSGFITKTEHAKSLQELDSSYSEMHAGSKFEQAFDVQSQNAVATVERSSNESLRKLRKDYSLGHSFTAADVPNVVSAGSTKSKIDDGHPSLKPGSVISSASEKSGLKVDVHSLSAEQGDILKDYRITYSASTKSTPKVSSRFHSVVSVATSEDKSQKAIREPSTTSSLSQKSKTREPKEYDPWSTAAEIIANSKLLKVSKESSVSSISMKSGIKRERSSVTKKSVSETSEDNVLGSEVNDQISITSSRSIKSEAKDSEYMDSTWVSAATVDKSEKQLTGSSSTTISTKTTPKMSVKSVTNSLEEGIKESLSERSFGLLTKSGPEHLTHRDSSWVARAAVDDVTQKEAGASLASVSTKSTSKVSASSFSKLHEDEQSIPSQSATSVTRIMNTTPDHLSLEEVLQKALKEQSSKSLSMKSESKDSGLWVSTASVNKTPLKEIRTSLTSVSTKSTPKVSESSISKSTQDAFQALKELSSRSHSIRSGITDYKQRNASWASASTINKEKDRQEISLTSVSSKSPEDVLKALNERSIGPVSRRSVVQDQADLDSSWAHTASESSIPKSSNDILRALNKPSIGSITKESGLEHKEHLDSSWAFTPAVDDSQKHTREVSLTSVDAKSAPKISTTFITKSAHDKEMQSVKEQSFLSVSTKSKIELKDSSQVDNAWSSEATTDEKSWRETKDPSLASVDTKSTLYKSLEAPHQEIHEQSFGSLSAKSGAADQVPLDSSWTSTTSIDEKLIKDASLTSSSVKYIPKESGSTIRKLSDEVTEEMNDLSVGSFTRRSVVKDDARLDSSRTSATISKSTRENVTSSTSVSVESAPKVSTGSISKLPDYIMKELDHRSGASLHTRFGTKDTTLPDSSWGSIAAADEKSQNEMLEIRLTSLRTKELVSQNLVSKSQASTPAELNDLSFGSLGEKSVAKDLVHTDSSWASTATVNERWLKDLKESSFTSPIVGESFTNISSDAVAKELNELSVGSISTTSGVKEFVHLDNSWTSTATVDKTEKDMKDSSSTSVSIKSTPKLSATSFPKSSGVHLNGQSIASFQHSLYTYATADNSRRETEDDSAKSVTVKSIPEVNATYIGGKPNDELKDLNERSDISLSLTSTSAAKNAVQQESSWSSTATMVKSQKVTNESLTAKSTPQESLSSVKSPEDILKALNELSIGSLSTRSGAKDLTPLGSSWAYTGTVDGRSPKETSLTSVDTQDTTPKDSRSSILKSPEETLKALNELSIGSLSTRSGAKELSHLDSSVAYTATADGRSPKETSLTSIDTKSTPKYSTSSVLKSPEETLKALNELSIGSLSTRSGAKELAYLSSSGAYSATADGRSPKETSLTSVDTKSTPKYSTSSVLKSQEETLKALNERSIGSLSARSGAKDLTHLGSSWAYSGILDGISPKETSLTSVDTKSTHRDSRSSVLKSPEETSKALNELSFGSLSRRSGSKEFAHLDSSGAYTATAEGRSPKETSLTSVDTKSTPKYSTSSVLKSQEETLKALNELSIGSLSTRSGAKELAHLDSSGAYTATAEGRSPNETSLTSVDTKSTPKYSTSSVLKSPEETLKALNELSIGSLSTRSGDKELEHLGSSWAYTATAEGRSPKETSLTSVDTKSTPKYSTSSVLKSQEETLKALNELSIGSLSTRSGAKELAHLSSSGAYSATADGRSPKETSLTSMDTKSTPKYSTSSVLKSPEETLKALNELSIGLLSTRSGAKELEHLGSSWAYTATAEGRSPKETSLTSVDTKSTPKYSTSSVLKSPEETLKAVNELSIGSLSTMSGDKELEHLGSAWAYTETAEGRLPKESSLTSVDTKSTPKDSRSSVLKSPEETLKALNELNIGSLSTRSGAKELAHVDSSWASIATFERKLQKDTKSSLTSVGTKSTPKVSASSVIKAPEDVLKALNELSIASLTASTTAKTPAYADSTSASTATVDENSQKQLMEDSLTSVGTKSRSKASASSILKSPDDELKFPHERKSEFEEQKAVNVERVGSLSFGHEDDFKSWQSATTVDDEFGTPADLTSSTNTKSIHKFNKIPFTKTDDAQKALNEQSNASLKIKSGTKIIRHWSAAEPIADDSSLDRSMVPSFGTKSVQPASEHSSQKEIEHIYETITDMPLKKSTELSLSSPRISTGEMLSELSITKTFDDEAVLNIDNQQSGTTFEERSDSTIARHWSAAEPLSDDRLSQEPSVRTSISAKSRQKIAVDLHSMGSVEMDDRSVKERTVVSPIVKKTGPNAVELYSKWSAPEKIPDDTAQELKLLNISAFSEKSDSRVSEDGSSTKSASEKASARSLQELKEQSAISAVSERSKSKTATKSVSSLPNDERITDLVTESSTSSSLNTSPGQYAIETADISSAKLKEASVASSVSDKYPTLKPSSSSSLSAKSAKKEIEQITQSLNLPKEQSVPTIYSAVSEKSSQNVTSSLSVKYAGKIQQYDTSGEIMSIDRSMTGAMTESKDSSKTSSGSATYSTTPTSSRKSVVLVTDDRPQSKGAVKHPSVTSYTERPDRDKYNMWSAAHDTLEKSSNISVTSPVSAKSVPKVEVKSYSRSFVSEKSDDKESTKHGLSSVSLLSKKSDGGHGTLAASEIIDQKGSKVSTATTSEDHSVSQALENISSISFSNRSDNNELKSTVYNDAKSPTVESSLLKMPDGRTPETWAVSSISSQSGDEVGKLIVKETDSETLRNGSDSRDAVPDDLPKENDTIANSATSWLAPQSDIRVSSSASLNEQAKKITAKSYITKSTSEASSKSQDSDVNTYESSRQTDLDNGQIRPVNRSFVGQMVFGVKTQETAATSDSSATISVPEDAVENRKLKVDYETDAASTKSELSEPVGVQFSHIKSSTKSLVPSVGSSASSHSSNSGLPVKNEELSGALLSETSKKSFISQKSSPSVRSSASAKSTDSSKLRESRPPPSTVWESNYDDDDKINPPLSKLSIKSSRSSSSDAGSKMNYLNYVTVDNAGRAKAQELRIEKFSSVEISPSKPSSREPSASIISTDSSSIDSKVGSNASLLREPESSTVGLLKEVEPSTKSSDSLSFSPTGELDQTSPALTPKSTESFLKSDSTAAPESLHSIKFSTEDIKTEKSPDSGSKQHLELPRFNTALEREVFEGRAQPVFGTKQLRPLQFATGTKPIAASLLEQKQIPRTPEWSVFETTLDEGISQKSEAAANMKKSSGISLPGRADDEHGIKSVDSKKAVSADESLSSGKQSPDAVLANLEVDRIISSDQDEGVQFKSPSVQVGTTESYVDSMLKPLGFAQLGFEIPETVEEVDEELEDSDQKEDESVTDKTEAKQNDRK